MALTLYLLLGVSLAGWILLEAGDLGASVFALFARDDGDRSACFAPSLPLFDGGELWLALHAAVVAFGFPLYGRVLFAVFGVPIVLLAVLTVARLVCALVRENSFDEALCRRCDVARGLCALPVLFVAGWIPAALLRGLPVDYQGRVAGGLLAALHPYALLGGCCAVLFGLLCGTVALLPEAEEPFAARARKIQPVLWLLLLFSGAAFLGWTIALPPGDGAFGRLPVWAGIAMTVMGLSLVSTLSLQSSHVAAGICARVASLGLPVLFFSLLFPFLVPSTTGDGMDHITVDVAIAGGAALRNATIACGAVALLLAVGGIVVARLRRKGRL